MRLESVMGKRAIEQQGLRGHLRYLCGLCIVEALCGINKQSENQATMEATNPMASLITSLDSALRWFSGSFDRSRAPHAPEITAHMNTVPLVASVVIASPLTRRLYNPLTMLPTTFPGEIRTDRLTG